MANAALQELNTNPMNVNVAALFKMLFTQDGDTTQILSDRITSVRSKLSVKSSNNADKSVDTLQGVAAFNHANPSKNDRTDVVSELSVIDMSSSF